MLRLAFDFIITWRETRTRPNAYGYCENREGATTETSQKTCRYCLYHSWLSGERR